MFQLYVYILQRACLTEVILGKWIWSRKDCYCHEWQEKASVRILSVTLGTQKTWKFVYLDYFLSLSWPAKIMWSMFSKCKGKCSQSACLKLCFIWTWSVQFVIWLLAVKMSWMILLRYLIIKKGEEHMYMLYSWQLTKI